MTWLLLLVPLSVALRYATHASPLWVFAVAALAIVPLAEWIRRATDQIARVAGSAIGGLLNVTFGNVAELILALFVLSAGRPDVVKGQITGSFIGNGLLGLGLAILVGSWGRNKQTFSRQRSGLLSSLLILSVIALLIPAIFDYTVRDVSPRAQASTLDEHLSLGVSILLIGAYGANLIYTLVTHSDVFGDDEHAEDRTGAWPLWRSLAVLVGGTAFVALESELVSGALEASAKSLGLSEFFLGVTVLAIIGNAAEYFAAVFFARQDRMGLVMSITVGSSIQVALLTAPVLVIVSYFIGHPMNLVFNNPLELIAIAGTSVAVRTVAQDGETTWFEGVLLLTVYGLLALAFFFVTPAA
jgi:Ca2+:H+ antiporter